jgi:hypothetical protein
LIGFWKSVGSLRNDLDWEALEGILGSLRWHKNLWFILLTSSTLLYVILTFLHNQTRWRHVSYTCDVPHHGNCEGWWSDLFNGSHLLVWSLRCLICVLSVWKSYEGWHALFKMNMSWVVMSPRFAIHVHSAWRICESRTHSIQTEGVWGWTLSMQRLDTWISFLYWTVMYVDASVTCWHGRFSSTGTLTTFRKSLSENRVAPTSYYRESRL